jgi:hypothetical protein
VILLAGAQKPMGYHFALLVGSTGESVALGKFVAIEDARRAPAAPTVVGFVVEAQPANSATTTRSSAISRSFAVIDETK